MSARAYLCTACPADNGDPGILDVHYDYAAARTDPFLPRHDVFRYLPLLPVREPERLLPAGATPLVSAPRLASRLGIAALYLKDETRNPTRCLKDRATSIGIALAIQCGSTDVYCASAGNAAISLAGYAAQAGLRCHVFVPSYASAARLDWLRRFAAAVHISTGNYDQAFSEAERAGETNGWHSRNCAFNPFLVEGKKTCALEIAETIAPDFVVAPVGDGCTLGAIGKGFREAIQMGIIDRLPRLIGVQASGVQPVVARFQRSNENGDGHTAAASIAVRHPRNALRLLREVEASNGAMVAVTDEEIARAQRNLSEYAGIVAEFTSAATLAAVEKLDLRDQTGVLVITGGRLD